MMKTIKQRRVKVADKYNAKGYGRGENKRTVYLIDGYYYVYHPAYAAQAFEPLSGELEGYLPVNCDVVGDKKFYFQCSSSKTGFDFHKMSQVVVRYHDPDGLPRAYAYGDYDALEEIDEFAREQLEKYCEKTISNCKNPDKYTKEVEYF